jgi:hypothetical protein
MATTRKTLWLTEEIADFLATCPSREQLLRYHPSAAIQRRARDLLDKLKNGRITEDEHRELDQFEYAEMLMRLVKARLRSNRTKQA